MGLHFYILLLVVFPSISRLGNERKSLEAQLQSQAANFTEQLKEVQHHHQELLLEQYYFLPALLGLRSGASRRGADPRGLRLVWQRALAAEEAR